MINDTSHAGVTALPLGHVISVRGSEAHVGIQAPTPGGENRASVGGFLLIDAGANKLVAMITEISAKSPGLSCMDYKVVAHVDLMGEITELPEGPRFRRGVSAYPTIGDKVEIIGGNTLKLIYGKTDARPVSIGMLDPDGAIPVHLDVDNLLGKHFAILGSTGVGKSSGLAVILNKILDVKPSFRVLILDGHNEYRRSFGEKAAVINARDLKLPFWLFNFEEFTDAIYGGRPPVVEEIEILAELIPAAKSAYLQQKSGSERLTALKRKEVGSTGFTVDTPVPYVIHDLLSLIDERMGKLENRASRMTHHRLMMRIEAIKDDARYAFMFSNANVGGDTMASLLCQLFRLEPGAQPVTILQLATFPAEVMDAVVCILTRLAFDFGLWSDGAAPLLLVCEEAHRYASADHSIGFSPTRRAIARVAKEGRKYGIYLGLVTQRPAELDPTILSQCSTLFAMRMASEQDQALLRFAVSDAAANLLAFVPSLGTGEVVAFGEGMPLPTRLKFETLPDAQIPQSESTYRGTGAMAERPTRDFVREVVDRWRGKASDQQPLHRAISAELQAERERPDSSPLPPGRPRESDASVPTLGQLRSIASVPALDQLRRQILKR